MKKLILCVFALLILTGSSFGAETAISSGEQTADAAIFSGSANISAIQVITDGTNDAKIVVHDSVTAANKVVFECTVSGSSHYGGRVFVPPIEVYDGIFADITGTGASYIIEYTRN